MIDAKIGIKIVVSSAIISIGSSHDKFCILSGCCEILQVIVKIFGTNIRSSIIIMNLFFGILLIRHGLKKNDDQDYRTGCLIQYLCLFKSLIGILYSFLPEFTATMTKIDLLLVNDLMRWNALLLTYLGYFSIWVSSAFSTTHRIDEELERFKITLLLSLSSLQDFYYEPMNRMLLVNASLCSIHLYRDLFRWSGFDKAF